MGADNWSRGKIRYHLESKGYATFTEIEAEYGLPPATISSTIRFPLEKGEDVISSILGLHPAEIGRAVMVPGVCVSSLNP